MAAVAAPSTASSVSLAKRILVLLELFALHMRDGDETLVPLTQWRQVLLLVYTKRKEAGVLTEGRAGCGFYDHVAAVLAQWMSLLPDDFDPRETARFAVLLLDFTPGHVSDALLQQEPRSGSNVDSRWVLHSSALLMLHRVMARERHNVDIATWLR